MAKPKGAAAVAEVPPPGAAIVETPVDQIERDKNQPRVDFTSVADIARTLKVKNGKAVEGFGIIVPVQLIRKSAEDITEEAPEPYRLKEGECRWRAAKQEGLLTIPSYFVAAGLPATVLADQVKAGVTQRSLRPLEVAAAIQRLTELSRRLSDDDLAFRCGLASAKHVRRFKVLGGLCPEVKAGLEEGKIELGHAEALATIASPELQAKAFMDVYALSVREARQHIRRRYHLLLTDCGFDPADQSLPGGSCEQCPKNTALQRRLWAEDDFSDALCTDIACFEQKRAKAWESIKARASASGITVIEGEEAGKAVNAWGAPKDDNLVPLDQPCPDDYDAAQAEGRKQHTWRQILDGGTHPIGASTLVRDKDGKVHELVTLAEARAAAERVGRADVVTGIEQTEAEIRGDKLDALPPRTDDEFKQRRAQRTAAREAAWKAVSAAARDETEARIGLLRFLCGMAVRADVDGVVSDEYAERHGIATPEVEGHRTASQAALLEHVAGIEDMREAVSMLVELLVGGAAENEGNGDDFDDPLPTACRFFGVEYGLVTPAVPSAPEDAEKPDPALVSAAPELPKEPLSGICRVCGCTDMVPCDDPEGPCAWVDPNETLCSGCAGVMQEIVDLLEEHFDGERPPTTFEYVIDKLEGDSQRTQHAIEDMLRTGEILAKDGVLLVPIRECRMCGSSSSGPAPNGVCPPCNALIDHIRKVCKDKPRTGPAIKAASRDWDKDRVHEAIKWMTANGHLDRDASGFSTVKVQP